MTFATEFVVQWKTEDDASVRVEESPGSGVAGLGLKNAEEHLAKAPLVQCIPCSMTNVINAQWIAPEKKVDDPKSVPC
jgi:hypothetical protein